MSALVAAFPGVPVLGISALAHQGLDELRSAIRALVGAAKTVPTGDQA